jgi:AraC-like DNA-binding protein
VHAQQSPVELPSGRAPIAPSLHAKATSADWPASRQTARTPHNFRGNGTSGLIVFDHKGRLVKADARAEVILGAIGVEVNCTPRLRIDALNTGGAGTLDEIALPHWLNPGWIEPIIDGSERLGTVVVIPELHPQRAAISHSGLPHYKLRRVLEYVRAHIDGPIALEQLAAAVAISPFHFHRQFKSSTGVTPHQYIVEVRVETAKKLLATTALPLTEIAARVGFADQSHFTATFRRATSTTPRNYRNANSET